MTIPTRHSQIPRAAHATPAADRNEKDRTKITCVAIASPASAAAAISAAICEEMEAIQEEWRRPPTPSRTGPTWPVRAKEKAQARRDRGTRQSPRCRAAEPRAGGQAGQDRPAGADREGPRSGPAPQQAVERLAQPRSPPSGSRNGWPWPLGVVAVLALRKLRRSGRASDLAVTSSEVISPPTPSTAEAGRRRTGVPAQRPAQSSAPTHPAEPPAQGPRVHRQ